MLGATPGTLLGTTVRLNHMEESTFNSFLTYKNGNFAQSTFYDITVNTIRGPSALNAGIRGSFPSLTATEPR